MEDYGFLAITDAQIWLTKYIRPVVKDSKYSKLVIIGNEAKVENYLRLKYWNEKSAEVYLIDEWTLLIILKAPRKVNKLIELMKNENNVLLLGVSYQGAKDNLLVGMGYLDPSNTIINPIDLVPDPVVREGSIPEGNDQMDTEDEVKETIYQIIRKGRLTYQKLYYQLSEDIKDRKLFNHIIDNSKRW
jgi:hypothetical protein